MEEIDFLVIGHVSQDVQADGFLIGGTVTYSAVTAHRLGRKVGVVTAAAPNFSPAPGLAGVQIHSLSSPVTTTFENIYRNGSRQQYLHAVARRIQPQDIPAVWHCTPIVHLGPIAQEFGPELLSLFSDSLVGITPQGWLRQWNGEGKVSVASWSDATQVLPKVNVLVFSPEDVGGDKGLMESYAQAAPLTVLTRGLKGAVLCQEGEIFYFPSRPAREIDPTGAGDVFAAAFLVRLEETEDPHEATRFANCVASFSVEGPGVQSIPWRAQVDKWLADNPRWGHGKGGWGELMGPSPCEPG